MISPGPNRLPVSGRSSGLVPGGTCGVGPLLFGDTAFVVQLSVSSWQAVGDTSPSGNR